MKINVKIINGVAVASITADGKLLTGVRSALDLMANVRCETDCDRIAVSKDAVADEFFILSTRLAGEILQKFINYQMRLAIYGDFTPYTSKPLRDFMRESNSGHDIFFVKDESEALERLSRA